MQMVSNFITAPMSVGLIYAAFRLFFELRLELWNVSFLFTSQISICNWAASPFSISVAYNLNCFVFISLMTVLF